MSDLHDTQQLPTIDTSEPPPKPTLAGLIVSKMDAIRKHQETSLSVSIGKLQTLVLILAIVIATLVLENSVLLVLVAWLVGHVR